MERKILKIGDSYSYQRIITENDIIIFSEVTGDKNPIHLDSEYAKDSFFKERIAQGFLVGSLISAAIGQHLPGNGTIYKSQSMNFKAPVKINDIITVLIEVIEFPKINQVKLKTTCINQFGVIVIDGEAVVIAPA